MHATVASQFRGAESLFGWAALPEDVPGELVDGHLVEEEVSSAAHEAAVVWLITMLYTWLRPRGGTVLGSDAKYGVRAPGGGRKPDVSAFLPGSRRPPRSGLITSPPDIAIEVVSPTPKDERRDRVEKLNEYAAFGVRWYWLVDPALRMFEILELGAGGRYIHMLGVTEGVIEPVPGCEGLRLDVAELWGEIDRLEPDESKGEADE
jgi:Uma2 family endonuclease